MLVLYSQLLANKNQLYKYDGNSKYENAIQLHQMDTIRQVIKIIHNKLYMVNLYTYMCLFVVGYY